MSRWGLYPWFAEHGLDEIHPDDRDRCDRLVGNVTVYHCVGTEGGYIVITSGEQTFRVRPGLFREVTGPRYRIGDVARTKEGSTAVVDAVLWHYKKAVHYYLVAVDGKRVGRRYFESDFIGVGAGGEERHHPSPTPS